MVNNGNMHPTTTEEKKSFFFKQKTMSMPKSFTRERNMSVQVTKSWMMKSVFNNGFISNSASAKNHNIMNSIQNSQALSSVNDDESIDAVDFATGQGNNTAEKNHEEKIQLIRISEEQHSDYKSLTSVN